MRAQDIPAELVRFIDERRSQPFAWGKNDCCLFAADWVHRSSGIDFAEGIRGTYFSALGAARVLKKYGGILGLAEKRASLRRQPPSMARRGDLLAHQMPGGLALGICLGEIAAYVGTSGLQFARSADASAGWRI